MAKQDPPDTAQRRYVVLHTAVDGYFQGQTITIDHLRGGLKREIDIDRLIRLGAIAPVGSDAARDALDAIPAGATTPAGDPVTADVPPPQLDVTHPDYSAQQPQPQTQG